MNPAAVVVAVTEVVSMLGELAKAFGLDEKTVIKVAIDKMPELAETPPDAGVAFDKVVEELERQ